VTIVIIDVALSGLVVRLPIDLGRRRRCARLTEVVGKIERIVG